MYVKQSQSAIFRDLDAKIVNRSIRNTFQKLVRANGKGAKNVPMTFCFQCDPEDDDPVQMLWVKPAIYVRSAYRPMLLEDGVDESDGGGRVQDHNERTLKYIGMLGTSVRKFLEFRCVKDRSVDMIESHIAGLQEV